MEYRNDLITRLFADSPAIAVDLTSDNQIAQAVAAPDVPEVAEQTLKLKMDAVMRQSTMDPSPTPSTSSAAAELSAGKKLMAAIKAEMALFSSSGTRGRCLQTAYSWLLTIPPTSVEAERAFSAAGIFCTKLRSRLSDNSIDTLCFLRAYYQKRR